jgi:hypothetical protein
VPPQSFPPHAAVPCLQIIEGYVDKVEWPAAFAHYRDFFTEYAVKTTNCDRLTAQRPANIHVIERYLLLASDLPRLHFSASLRPR